MSGLQVGFVETPTGPAPVLATSAGLAGWNTVTGAWNFVTLQNRYFPMPHPLLPSRGANNAGETVSYPAPEAAALVAGGYATAVSGTPNQSGDWSPT